MDPVLATVLGCFSALCGLVTIILVIRKSGSRDGELHTTLKTVASDVSDMKSDFTGVKADINEIKVQNAARDADAKADRRCVEDMKKKVDEHDKVLQNIHGKVAFIENKLVIIPERREKPRE